VRREVTEGISQPLLGGRSDGFRYPVQVEPISTSVITVKLLAGAASKLGSVGMGLLLTKAQRKPGGSEQDIPVAIEVACEVVAPDLRQTARQALQDWSKARSFVNTLSEMVDRRQVLPDMLEIFAEPQDFAHPLTRLEGSRALAEAFLIILLDRVLGREGVKLQIEDHRQMIAKLDEHNSLRKSEHREVLEGQEFIVGLLQDLTQSRVTAPLPVKERTSIGSSTFEDRFIRIQHSIADDALNSAERRLKLLQEDQANMSSLEYARYLRLQGSLAQRLGNIDQAVKHFMNAFEHDHSTVAAYRMRGLAEYLTEAYAAALEHFDAALALEPNDAGALTTKLYVLMAMNNTEGMAEMDDAALSQDSEFTLARARSRIARKNYQGADQLLSGLMAKDGDDGRIWFAQAVTKVLPFQDRMLAEEWSLEQIQSRGSADPKLKTALDAVEKALFDPKAKLTNQPERRQAYNLNQVLLIWRGDFETLRSRCLAALAEDSTDVISRRHLIMALRKLTQFADVWAEFLKLPETERDIESTISGTDAALRIGRASEAVPELERLLKLALNPEAHNDVIISYARALLDLERFQELTDFLMSQPAGAFAVELSSAELYAKTGDFAQAQAAYERAIVAAPPRDTAPTRVQYAYFLLNAGLNEQDNKTTNRKTAEAQLRLTLADPLSAGALEAILLTFINWGQHADAAHALASLRAVGPLTSNARQAEAIVEAHAGNLDTAVLLLQTLLADEPTNISAAFNYARSLENNKQLEAAIAELRRIVTEIPNVTTDDLVQAADAAKRMGNKDLALEWGYRARREAYSDPRLHHWYGQMGMELLDEVGQQMVSQESAVLLENDKRHQQWIIITGDPLPRREFGEYPVDGRVAQVLLGKRIGDQVKVREGVGGIVRINAVLSKYANAVRQYGREHTLTFLDDDAILVQEFYSPPSASSGLSEEEADLRREATVLDTERRKVRRRLEEFNRPVATNAVIALQTGVEFWIHEFEHHAPVTACMNTADDQNDAEGALDNRIVVDASALVSLARAKSLHLLSHWNDNMLITRSTLDALETASGIYSDAQAAWKFAVDHMSIDDVPALPFEALGDLFPADTYSSIMAANRLGCPLITEDSHYRRLMRQGELGAHIRACGTVDLLIQLNKHKAITSDRAAEFMFNFFAYGRQVLPIKEEFLEYALDRVEEDAEALDSSLALLLACDRLNLDFRAETLKSIVWLLAQQFSHGVHRLTRLLDFLAFIDFESDELPQLLQSTQQKLSGKPKTPQFNALIDLLNSAYLKAE
jgi:tetratricopeptide (TPR) repeat protein